MTQDTTALWHRIAGHFHPKPPRRLGVAVSGGSDSLALLLLVDEWRENGGPEVFAVTVDHGLRPEAAGEAKEVARICAGRGIAHETLTWRDWDQQGNLPDQARRARYRLMAEWAKAQGIGDIAIGHTADDQAETFLMRLARGAGVDGLSAMRTQWQQGDLRFHRPMLGLTRETLRDMLRARGQGWVDDPSNEDTAYARVRARAALVALEPLGISAGGLADVARKMADVRDTLYGYVIDAARENLRFEQGDLILGRAGFERLRPEVARRLLQAMLGWISGADYVPRGRAMEALLAAARDGRGMTLQGCLLSVTADDVRLSREFNAVAGLRVPVDGVWDGRWYVEQGPDIAGAELAALGEAGLRACPDWRLGGVPRASALALPGVWRGDELLGAPLLGWANGWSIKAMRGEEEFHKALLSH
ncbi:tRNA lysidine(34) synthetase TilS [Roseovarius sp.]|uniref:tRNA lysidine(34) synthetase TilS n=1 Tax=Roseovarius sp. TaxID=1486281 RepID=UPI0026371A83|nr:tRNA lysidine(34) synthetase TilS [Roseovarius sp.]